MGTVEDQEDDVNVLVTSKCKKLIEIVFLSCFCAIISIAFCIPIVIYATSSDTPPIPDLEIDEFDIDNCSQQVSRECM